MVRRIAFACALATWPPAALTDTILSKAELARPVAQQSFWKNLKEQLTGANGQEYFEAGVRDAVLPDLRGTLVSQPAVDRWLLALSDATHSEVELVVKNLRGGVDVTLGSQIEFAGVATDFVPEPFRLVFEVDGSSGARIPDGSGLGWIWYFGPFDRSDRRGSYRDTRTAVQFQVPPGWTIRTIRSAGLANLAVLTNSSFPNLVAGIWMWKEEQSDNPASSRLRDAIPETIAQRAKLADYTIRPESIRQLVIGGQQAIQMMADYRDGATAMSETVTWIAAENVTAMCFARTSLDGMPALQTAFDQLVYTVSLP